MKKLLSLALALLLVLTCIPIKARAAEVASGTCGENLTWVLDDMGNLTISGTGAMEDYTWSEDPSWADHKSLIITVTVNEGVTYIGDQAFNECTHIKKLSLPSTLKSVGYRAFFGCSGLTEIVLPEGMIDVGSGAFWNCTAVKTLTIPESLINISDHAFAGLDGLETVYYNAVAASDRAVDNYIFSWCGTEGSAIQVVIGAKVSRIPSYLFCGLVNATDPAGCAPRITSVAFEADSVCTSIGKYAFSDCVYLENVVLPDSVTTIEDYAFCDCTALTDITLPGNLTSIGTSAFQNCTALAALHIPNSVSSTGNYVFSGCTSLADVNIPSSLTSLAKGTFSGCSALRTIELPDTLTTIGDSAFSRSGLTSITIHENITSIGSTPFYYCTSLKNVYFNADNIEHNGGGILDDAGSSTTAGGSIILTIGANVTHIPDSMFRPADTGMVDLGEVRFEKGSKCTSIGASAFYNCAMSKVTLPESITTIGGAAFSSCSYLTSVNIPKNVTSIGNRAFNYCTRLRSVYYDAANVADLDADSEVFASAGSKGTGIAVTIGKNAGRIPANLFYVESASPMITSVTFERASACTAIGHDAFSNCDDLTSITLPNGLESIAIFAFSGCTGLSEVTFTGNAPAIGSYAFDGVTASCYYPEGNDTWTEDVMQDYGGTLTWDVRCADLDGDGDHACDACGAADVTDCVDYDRDHDCDECGTTISECSDTNRDHYCDLCGTKVSECTPGSYDPHYCNICNALLVVCGQDDDHDHLCDACSIVVSFCVDNNGDALCDICNQQTINGPLLTPNADGIYEIGTAGQLYQFAAMVYAGESTANAVLIADIVVNEDVLNENYELREGDFLAWTPMVYYRGKFDGQGHTISGIYFNDSTKVEAGLFADTYGATISNLNLRDSYICGSNNTGGIVGDAYASNITACTFEGTVIGGTSVGGIAGEIYSVKFSGCASAGMISGTTAVGGVVGENTACTISDCTNTATVTGSKQNVGGISGFNNYDGPSHSRYYASIKNCSNSGNVTCGGAWTGGIAGQLQGTATNCSNTGTITGGMTGGILGEGNATNCWNTGAVTGSNTGGIIGREGSATNCWNSGAVTGTGYVGGIGGYNCDADYCYNLGPVNFTGAQLRGYAGGIVGNINATRLRNCYNAGKVNGVLGKMPYALYGHSSSSKYIENNYYLVEEAVDSTSEIFIPMTMDAFTSGKVAYLLGEPFGQNLDNGEPVQDFPVLSDARVYLTTAKTCDGQDYTWAEGKEVYSNYEDTVITVHSYDQGTCTLCGHVIYTRLAGANRYDTAIQVADEMKEVLDIEKFDAVILANGYNFADALAGSYLSTVKDAPILLTWNGAEKYNYLNDATIEYVKNNLKPGGTVYILGGTSAVPASIDARLSEFHVHRMAGANRFETNIMILEEAGVPAGSEILVCTSSNFADSLSASATGKPILLVWNDRGVLYGDQPKFLEELQAKGCTFTVIGGESAVSGKMAATVGEYGEVDRLAGANRFETSVQVAEKYFPEAESAVLAYAWDFPDGLCGGGLANAMNAPLILTMTRYEAQAADYIQRQGISYGVVLGGEKLISEGSVHLIFDLIAED